MGRPVTMFTGQWAALPLESLAEKASGWGYDGLELICLGDHLDPERAARDKSYARGQRALASIEAGQARGIYRQRARDFVERGGHGDHHFLLSHLRVRMRGIPRRGHV